jgi:hypothetical protein
MNKGIFICSGRYIIVLVFVTVFFLSFQPIPKQTGDIILKDEKLSITPAEFYIANVVDERDDRTAVAWLLPAASMANNQPKLSPVDLHGGTLVAIKQFIDRNLPANKSLHPVIISLKKFQVTESALAGGRIEGHVSLVMSFGLDKGEDSVLHLADYAGNAVYNRSAGPPQDIEPTLRHLLENSLIYINTWMDRQAGSNIKLAKTVKVTFTDYTEKPEGDTIYYAVNRPLSWNDFQSKIPSGRYDAEIFPAIGYNEDIKVANSVINMKLVIKVSLPKSACWVKSGNANDYTLNHEQRHFDIAKIAAEHFKRKISAENLPVDNFEGPVNMDYLDAYREMDSLQKQYDDETRHGTDQSAQQQWNKRIDKELKELGVK